MSEGQGLEIELDQLAERITTLTALGDLTGDLVATASRLAERLPLLGTAPPAVHLAMRLREAAGSSGLTGEVKATQQDVRDYQQKLGDARKRYQEHEDRASEELRKEHESGPEAPGRAS